MVVISVPESTRKVAALHWPALSFRCRSHLRPKQNIPGCPELSVSNRDFEAAHQGSQLRSLQLLFQAHVFGQSQDLLIADRQHLRALRRLAVGDLVAQIVEVVVQRLAIQLSHPGFLVQAEAVLPQQFLVRGCELVPDLLGRNDQAVREILGERRERPL